ncbi:MAG: DUF1080 domain-containing protein [Verrucomicrobia bacterium]|nr:DUF1080 domain-containing protein [Cytophagales bacterium]
MKHHFPKLFFLPLLWIACLSGYAQEIPMKTLTLDDLSNFRNTPGNWQIVGNVTMDRTLDIHQKPAEMPSKKNKKSDAPAKNPVTFTAGKGILLNNLTPDLEGNLKKAIDAKDWAKVASYQLFTTWEHGDIELELEVMLPKGSNSGIYLQGRYEVQLYDSWGVKNPSFSDIGGIYRNWENTPGKIYMGKAPLTNAAKAPGLWQKMKINFQAPRFNESGQKIANARFISVELNGVKIHNNVEVPLLTGGAVEDNEKATGPLMIQGDHGAVAFRNIKYRVFGTGKVVLNALTYNYYEGSFKQTADVLTASTKKSGNMPLLTWDVGGKEDKFGYGFDGKITVPEDAKYFFTLQNNGGAKLLIDKQAVVDHDGDHGVWEQGKGSINLTAGTHDFTLLYFKNTSWLAPNLGLFVESANMRLQPLHAFTSLPPDESPVSPILIEPTAETKLLRAFLDFRGNNQKRLTHTIGVGEPSGIHYVYDLKAGNIVCIWKGKFVDATPMWQDRGDGSFRTLGGTQYLFTDQPLGVLANANAAFPKEYDEANFRGKGYSLDEATGRPVFKYVVNGLEVEDKIVPDDENRILTREIKIISAQKQANTYFKLAEGNSIETMPDGSFAVDDKQYYIKVISADKPVIREVNGRKELVVFVNASVKYSIIW